MATDQPIHDMTDTWSSGGTTFHAIKMNVTDAASAADSSLITMEVGGEWRFILAKDGTLKLAGGLELGRDLEIAHGGTGASTATAARNNLGVTAAIEEACAAAVTTVRGEVPAEFDTLAELLALVQGSFLRKDGAKLSPGGSLYREPSSGSTLTTARAATSLASFTGGNNLTGAIVFLSPAGVDPRLVMHSLSLRGATYSPPQTIDTVVNAYAFDPTLVGSTGPFSFVNVAQVTKGSLAPMVRFARAGGGRIALVVGEVGTVWSFPHLVLDALFTNKGLDAYCAGWTSALMTDLSSLTELTVDAARVESLTAKPNRAGDTFTGLMTFFAGVAARAGINLPQRAADPTAPIDGDFWPKATGLFYRLGGVIRQSWDSVNLPAPSDGEILAGAVTEPRAYSPANVKRAIDVLGTRGTSFRGAQGATQVGTADQVLGTADFTATGPAVKATANASVDSGNALFAYMRLDIIRVDTGAVIHTGPETFLLHQATHLERLIAEVDFTGLTRGVMYRVRAIARTSASSAAMGNFITGINA